MTGGRGPRHAPRFVGAAGPRGLGEAAGDRKGARCSDRTLLAEEEVSRQLMTRAWIGAGSNEGDRLGFVKRGLKLLVDDPAIELATVSSLYDTAPYGVEDQPRFLNLVAGLDTDLPAESLLARLLEAEDRCGRVRRERWGPRTLDLDLLVYGDEMLTTDVLTVPHPGIVERAFVLVPFAEVAPDVAVPGAGATVSELLERLGDTSDVVTRIGDAPNLETS